MKVRSGFVSNSSSSSFVVLGVRADRDEVEKALGEDPFFEMVEDKQDVLYDDGEAGYVYYGPWTYVDEDDGVDDSGLLKEIPENETLAQIKDRMLREARALFGQDAELEFGLFAGTVAT